MKQRTAYWIPTINVLVILAVLCMLGSAVVRIVFYAGETQIPGSILAFQILLPLAANVLFALLLLTSGRDQVYRTAVPVWLGCVFFAVKAAGFDSLLHTVLCLLLYALVAVLYTATVTGRVPTQVLLYPLFGLPLLYHIFIEDPVKLRGADLRGWLLEISVLLCMASMLSASAALRRKKPRRGSMSAASGTGVMDGGCGAFRPSLPFPPTS